MEKYIKFILRYRFAVLTLVLLITAAATATFWNAEVSTSLFKLFFGDSPKYQRYLERTAQFSTDNLAIIAFEEEQLLAQSTIKRLEKTVADLKTLPDIARVHSLLDIMEVKVLNGLPSATRYVDTALQHPKDIPDLMEKLRSDPMAGGMLVSKDGKHSLLVIEFVKDDNRPDDKFPGIMDNITSILASNGFEKEKLHQAGLIPLMVEMGKQTHFNIQQLFPFVCLLLLVTVLILFHRLWPVLITLLVTSIGVAWTMGLAVFMFDKISILMAMTPGIIMIISFSDVVHLCSSYLMELSRGETKSRAIVKACSEVGSACFYTSITTFFGFIALALVPVPAFRQLGIILGLGVTLALLLAMTLTPVVFSLLKTPKPMRVGAASKAQIMLNRLLDATEAVTRKHPTGVCVFFGLLVLVSFIGISRVRFETDIVRRMDEGNVVRIDARYFAEHFDGTNFIDLYIKNKTESKLTTPELYATIFAFQKTALQLPPVDSAFSVINLLEGFHALFHPDEKGAVPT
ncbi:MAG: MMPL family transporter, partial [bacterium]|nr:MMPL family transporter [bacterium]